MTSPAAAIRIPDLTRLDELELRKELGPDAVRFEHDQHADEMHGEIATATAIMLVSLAALRVLAVHLARAHDRKSFRKRVEIEHPDGRRQVEEIVYETSSSEAPEAEVLKQLATACAIDATELAKV
jgi:hypothetical protein